MAGSWFPRKCCTLQPRRTLRTLVTRLGVPPLTIRAVDTSQFNQSIYSRNEHQITRRWNIRSSTQSGSTSLLSEPRNTKQGLLTLIRHRELNDHTEFPGQYNLEYSNDWSSQPGRTNVYHGYVCFAGKKCSTGYFQAQTPTVGVCAPLPPATSVTATDAR